jgi:hypothetical protein
MFFGSIGLAGLKEHAKGDKLCYTTKPADQTRSTGFVVCFAIRAIAVDDWRSIPYRLQEDFLY